MYYLLYEITNLVNGKTYIGQHTTENIDDGYIGSGKNILRAIKKYGKENFKKEILLYAKNEVALNFFERALVTPEFCALKTNYNLREGGGNKGRPSKESVAKQAAALRGRKHSAEHKAKISATMKKRFLFTESHRKGKKLSAEHKAKISAFQKGKKLSLTTIAKIQESRRKNGTTGKGIKRSPVSLETKEKISAALKGKKRPPLSLEHKAKIVAARKKNGTNKHSSETIAKISAALKGKKKSPMSLETKAKISAFQKGRKKSPETRAKMSAWQKGVKKSLEHIAKIKEGKRIQLNYVD
jgi:hypothetical protein